MNLKLLFKIVIFSLGYIITLGYSSNIYAEEAKFTLAPYINGITSIKEGIIEFGPEITNKEKTIVIRPYARLPLTDKQDSKIQIDRFTSTWRAILAVDLVNDKTQATGPVNRFTLAFQGEWGVSEFKYYPDKTKTRERKTDKTSFALETKGIWFYSEGKTNATQWGPQIRLRYTRDWKESDEIGIVVPSTDGSANTVTNLRVEAPSVKPSLSPAISFLYYPGNHPFGYTPALYYDLTGKNNSYNPFNGTGRLRFEGWVFYFPAIQGMPNVKIGAAPVLSYRTHGTDKLDTFEYGGLFQVKFGTNLLQFF